MEMASFFDQAAHQAPDYGMLAYNAGTMLYEVDEFDRAIVHLDRARELLGEQNAVQMNRALTLQQMGRLRMLLMNGSYCISANLIGIGY